MYHLTILLSVRTINRAIEACGIFHSGYFRFLSHKPKTLSDLVSSDGWQIRNHHSDNLTGIQQAHFHSSTFALHQNAHGTSRTQITKRLNHRAYKRSNSALLEQQR